MGLGIRFAMCAMDSLPGPATTSTRAPASSMRSSSIPLSPVMMAMMMYIGWMSSLGISPEFATIIAIGEIVPGILLFVGVLSRLSAGVLAAIMVSAIFIIKDPAIITGDKGIELDLILLAGALVLVVAGPGRLSIAHIAKRIPRPIH